ncbi:hypothetical protein ACH5RR_024394 [Cinchona calisaya]|uniref:Sey1/RHD3-like three-helix bundle domain-containing protein n=1 Tax=Cinchona calisaya TaxID=153742 RepID=A0ABD2YWJ6_9GENT
MSSNWRTSSAWNYSHCCLSSALSGFEMDEKMKEKMQLKLEAYDTRGVVDSKAKEEAGRVLLCMKDRFSTLVSHDSDTMQRVWTGGEDFRAVTKTACSSSLKLLSVRVAIGLDDEVDKTLALALVDSKGVASTNIGRKAKEQRLPSNGTDKEEAAQALADLSSSSTATSS